MRSPSPSPAVPAEALARQRRLQAILEGMVAQAPSREAACLQELRSFLDGRTPFDSVMWLQNVQRASLAEEAAAMLRAGHPRCQDQNGLGRLEQDLAPLVAQAHAKRLALHHLDTRRVVVRFGFSKVAPALDLDDRGLQAIFLQAFRLEGLMVALDLGKRPRPMLMSDHPLPAGVGGLDEAMEVTLRDEPKGPAEDLMLRLQRRLPGGLEILGWTVIPYHASSLGDLGLCSRWQWLVPRALQARIKARCEAFGPNEAQADAFFLEMTWEDPALRFSSRLGDARATNPIKALAAWLGISLPEIQGLQRVGLDLKGDGRLTQGDRFQPKLKNIYEDAVLLGGASNIVLVDEDDDDPIQLG